MVSGTNVIVSIGGVSDGSVKGRMVPLGATSLICAIAVAWFSPTTRQRHG